MPGVRDRNLRSGDLHEDLGIALLKCVALVAPVPRQEDVGADGFATLIRPDSGRRLIPDLSFLVQLKSSSVRSVAYRTKDEMRWLSELDTPFFIGRVDRGHARLELFTTLRLHQVLLETGHDGVELLLDEASESSTTPSIRRANIGPPVHVWSMADANSPDFLARSHAILRPHVDALRRNRLLRNIQFQQVLQWKTGEPPTDFSSMMLISSRSEIADTLREMIPHVNRLLLELLSQKRYDDFPEMLAFMDLMARWGVDPDPKGHTRMMVGSRAEGPRISLEDAIRWRYVFQSRGSDVLDLCRLQLKDESLSAIPSDVKCLALVDNPITDTGATHLLRLENLVRLNVAGTFVTNEGLHLLAKLPKLQWVCVHRTSVSNEGIASLRTLRPELEVLSDSEP